MKLYGPDLAAMIAEHHLTHCGGRWICDASQSRIFDWVPASCDWSGGTHVPGIAPSRDVLHSHAEHLVAMLADEGCIELMDEAEIAEMRAAEMAEEAADWARDEAVTS